MSQVTEFQSHIESAVIHRSLTRDELISLIKQVVAGEGGRQLNQKRLAEILIAIIGLTNGGNTGGGVVPAPGNLVMKFVPNGNTLNVTYNGGAISLNLTETHGNFITNLISDGSTTKQALEELAAIISALGGSPGSPSGLYEYSDGDCAFIATGLGITAVWNTGELTVTIPENVVLISFVLNMQDGSNIQAGADASGATKWIRVKIVGGDYNVGKSSIRVPIIQKTFYASGGATLSNPYSIDIDNNPNMAVVGIQDNSITIRIWNITAPNGLQLSFSI